MALDESIHIDTDLAPLRMSLTTAGLDFGTTPIPQQIQGLTGRGQRSVSMGPESHGGITSTHWATAGHKTVDLDDSTAVDMIPVPSARHPPRHHESMTHTSGMSPYPPTRSASPQLATTKPPRQPNMTNPKAPPSAAKKPPGPANNRSSSASRSNAKSSSSGHKSSAMIYHTQRIDTLGLGSAGAIGAARSIRQQQVRQYRELVPSSHLGAGARKQGSKNTGILGRGSARMV